ncbi:hypothetical protein GGI07_000276 [Coemansia sp. Benny D115]|nr:hypothetical protein GGI07_000276 [Coemansia sp. Benny D115]
MDINDIFKESVTNTSLTASKNKRKLGATPSLRQLKDLGYGTEAPNNETNDTLNSKRIRTEPDHPDTQEPNSNDEDDDEGGRFFADGLTTQQKDVLEWVDNADDIEETLDHQGVQKLVSKLEHAMSKNTQQRIKHADKPQEFAESEADLDEAIRNFLPLTNNPKYLHVLEDLGAIPSLVELLGHENEDIVMDVIELVSELTSMDAWEQDGESSEEKQWVMEFVSALQKSEFFSALGYSLRRLSKNTRDGDSESTYEGDDASDDHSWKSHVDRLVELNIQYAENQRSAEELLRARDDEDVEEGYLDRQESGLFALQTTDIVIAFVSTDQGARERIVQRLRRKGRSLKDVGTELTEYIAAKQASTLEAIDLRGKSADTGSSSAALDSDADLTDMLAHL